MISTGGPARLIAAGPTLQIRQLLETRLQVVLLRVEEVTADDQVDHVAQAIIPSSELCGQLVYVSTVAKGKWSAQSVGRQLMHHRSGELILSVGQQIPLEPIYPSQRLPIEEFRSRIDRLVTDLSSKCSESVVVLKRDAPRVDLGVTRNAGRLVPMICDPFFESHL